MVKVSVIVPVYNVEKYLRKCLDSIVSQTLNDLEIILVNDGSTDTSPDICEEYKRKDERIKMITQKNQGLSAARNAGLKEAAGEYVIFIDSDDYIAENMLEILVNNITKSSADIATCGIYNVYQSYMKPQYHKKEKYTCGNVEAYRQILIGKKIPASICNKLLKRECIEDLEFPVGKHYEDAFFHIDLMQQVKTVCVDTQPLYYYVHRSGSITTRKYQKSSYDIVEAYEKNIRMVQEKYPSLMPESEFRVFWAYFVVLDRMLKEKEYRNIEQYKHVKRYLKKHVKDIIKNPYFTRNRKIAAIILKFNLELYRILSRKDQKSKMVIS